MEEANCPGIGAASWPSLDSISDGTAVAFQHEVNLAWELALVAKPHLDDGERNYVFVKIGAGETFSAIRALLKWVAIKSIPVTGDLVQRTVSWLDAYVGHDDERYLRRLLEGFVFSLAIQVSQHGVTASGTESVKRAQLVHHVHGSDLVRLRERRAFEHRIH